MSGTCSQMSCGGLCESCNQMHASSGLKKCIERNSNKSLKEHLQGIPYAGFTHLFRNMPEAHGPLNTRVLCVSPSVQASSAKQPRIAILTHGCRHCGVLGVPHAGQGGVQQPVLVLLCGVL